MAMFENLGRTMHPGDTLKLRCDACGHQADFDQPSAFKLFGQDASPFEIRRRVRCRYCQAAGRASVWL